MARRRPQRPWQLLHIILLASSASASGVSLSSFELLSGIFITVDCLNAYNAPLIDCDISDFLAGSRCSRSCMSSLRTIETNIQRACDNVSARPGTLLDRTQDGDLVAALCGAEDDEPPVPAPVPAPDAPRSTTTLTTITRDITPRPRPTTTSSRPELGDDTTTSARPVDPPGSSQPQSSEPDTTFTISTRTPDSPSETASEVPNRTSAPGEGDASEEDGSNENEDNEGGDDGPFPDGSGGGSPADEGFNTSEATVNLLSRTGVVMSAAVILGWRMLW